MSDCIFCQIIKGDIPSYKVYEDDVVFAFLDMTQVTKGHTLVVPKKHVEDLFAYDEKLAADVFSRIPKIAQALDDAFPEADGLNVLNNNRQLAYQSVFHSHFHLIPRYGKDDDFSIHFGNHQADYPPEKMQAIADQISKHVAK
ncbi:HIT family protein [Enterococcus timonensis]|uniref:HIT family protein n=1 Tax=Enterococcus timonensis TaxID=1852364 RepID=UPI0008DAC716|nr:HIT family protein [Enterococcus timonensis]